MPLTLIVSESALPKDAIVPAAKRISEAFLATHDLAGNKVMTPNLTSHIQVIPEGMTLSGGEPVVGAWIETKTPSFAVAERSVQESFFAKATEILLELSDGRLKPERIWSNSVHAVDGSWNLNGQAMTNEQLGHEIAKG